MDDLRGNTSGWLRLLLGSVLTLLWISALGRTVDAQEPTKPIAADPGFPACPDKDWSKLPYGSPFLRNSSISVSGPGGMSGHDVGTGREHTPTPEETPALPVVDRSLRITFKPVGRYTEAARSHCIQGQVLLKVRFLKDGSLGKISVKKGLSFGLNEEAIKAARQLRFEPQIKDGKPVSSTKVLQYNFTIY